MNQEQTLFERLRNPECNAPRTITEDTELLAESVLRHLQKMLNTRQGHTLTLPEYGMPDITSFRHALPEAVSAMENDIKNSIDKYEPRLRNVSVSQVPLPDGEMILRFEVTGELVTAREEASVLFETSINPSGYIEIKG